MIAAGAYQFSSIKAKCLGYCESPMSFFMGRWRDGEAGAVTMGTYNGIYCLGCCWPYFLLMVTLAWMDILWIAMFAGVIFEEKMWSRGIWVAKAARVGLAAAGMVTALGIVDISGHDAMMEQMQGMQEPTDQTPSMERDSMQMDDMEDQMPEGMQGMDM